MHKKLNNGQKIKKFEFSRQSRNRLQNSLANLLDSTIQDIANVNSSNDLVILHGQCTTTQECHLSSAQ